jgi:hypothetical protein
VSGDTVKKHAVEPDASRDEMPTWLWWLPPAGLLFVLLYSFSQGFFSREYFGALGVGVLTSGAALMVGALLGFLFGIPRTLQGERPPDVLEDRGEGGRAPEYRVNTNLEQISDWLTKILVGVGLVQLSSIIDALGRLADHLGPALGDDTTGPAFALALVVYFAVSGFLVAYLWTRLNLTGAFARAEASMLKSYVDTSIKQMADTVDERVGNVERDVNALSLAERQLDPESDPVAPDELEKAVAASSPALRAQIFARARAQRSAGWRTDQARMERTIPLFEALVASDTDHRYHRNFAQLGFALKDRVPPDYDRAIQMLSEAIRIRGDRGHAAYEFNRAVARIGADPAKTPEALRDAILADLRVAASSRYWMERINGPGPVQLWLKRIGVAPGSLL